jgi:hypothetical protein
LGVECCVHACIALKRLVCPWPCAWGAFPLTVKKRKRLFVLASRLKTNDCLRSVDKALGQVSLVFNSLCPLPGFKRPSPGHQLPRIHLTCPLAVAPHPMSSRSYTPPFPCPHFHYVLAASLHPALCLPCPSRLSSSSVFLASHRFIRFCNCCLPCAPLCLSRARLDPQGCTPLPRAVPLASHRPPTPVDAHCRFSSWVSSSGSLSSFSISLFVQRKVGETPRERGADTEREERRGERWYMHVPMHTCVSGCARIVLRWGDKCVLHGCTARQHVCGDGTGMFARPSPAADGRTAGAVL